MSPPNPHPDGAGPRRSPLPRLQGFDRETFARDFDRARRPVVLSGAVASWPALGAWTPEAFAERFRDLEVSASVDLPDSQVPYLFRNVDHRRKMTFGAFVERLGAGDRCYVDQADVKRFAGLEEDYSFAPLGAADVRVTSLWLGARTRSGLHYDYLDNLFAQVYGEKRALLVAPEAARLLYPFADNVTKSQVAPESPDLGRHRRFARATLHEALLEPGDVLFIPQGWWHYLATPGVSISLSCWYGHPLPRLHDARVMLRTGVRGWGRLIRDFFWHGVLGRPYEARLYSLPPTGKLIWDLLVSALPRRRRPSAAG